jgi:eukaryotic translation initiation factor 2-alpha kinase 4
VCTKKFLQVLLFQEFLLGISLFSISGGLGWYPEGASMAAKGVLDALIFLHNNGISHGNLLDSTVFMDNFGFIKLTYFSSIPFLQKLVNPKQQATADLPALGTLIESLIPTPHLEMRDFINRCKSERTISSNDLLEHPFLYSMISNDHSQSPNDEKVVSMVPPRSINVQMPTFATSDHSWLKTEFEMESFIGKGAYGDVLKVRNILDSWQYAIKCIPLSSKNKQLYKKMTREVELLSQLNHENVVRYFNSWIETQSTPIAPLDDEDESEWSISWGMVKTHSQNHLVGDSSSDSDDSSNPGMEQFYGKHWRR